jgi:hypothetical protein
MVGADRPLYQFGEELNKPATMVWCVLVAAQVAIWSYLVTPAYSRARRYASSFRAQRRSVIADFVVLLLMFGIFAYAHRRVTSGLALPVVGQVYKVPLLNLLGFMTLLPCLLGMRLVAFAARAEGVAGVSTALLDRFARFRTDLNWFLGSAAVIIGAATLSNGAFRNAMNMVNPPPARQLPASEVLLYGGFCSAVLGLFYLSSHDTFSRSGWALIRAAEPVGDESTAAWVDAQTRRGKLAEVMGVGRSSIQSFQDGAVVLAPMFSSAVPLLLGKP